MQYKRAPWAHQKEAVEKAILQMCYALFFEMGTGKSFTAINILRALFEILTQNKPQRTIIFCPPLVIPNWVNEWKMFSDLTDKHVIPLYGSQVKRCKTFLEHTADGQGKIFICNYESLLMQNLFDLFVAWKPEALVFDESHSCKSPTARRSKAASLLANPPGRERPYVQILSGTPVLNSPMDLFMQFKILDGGRAFGTNFFAFRARYFRDRNAAMPKDRYFPKWEVMTLERDGFDAEAAIKEKMSDVSMRVLKSECLDLPPEVSVTLKVPMSGEQKRLYEEMKADFVTYYKSQACVASLAIVKLLRLMQISSGFLCVETDREDMTDTVKVALPRTPKLEALKQLLQELVVEQGHKVIVWAVWKENYRQIREVFDELGIKYTEAHGDVPSDIKRREAVEKFQKDPSIQCFLSHPGSGGIGVNLTVAAFDVTYSRNFKLVEYLQARSRNHRGGAKEAGHEKITHYDLVCEGSIDELALQKLAGKIDMSDKLLNEIVGQI